MSYIFIARACSDLPVSACCRVMKVSTSGFYAWQANPMSDKDLDDGFLTDTIVDIHRMSRRSYGSPESTPSCASARTCDAAANESSGSCGRQASRAFIDAGAGDAPVGTRWPSPLTTW